jgi:hypothetical protein
MVTATTITWIYFALITKHLLCDFPLQWEYQWKNKGTYGHPGGLLHALIHFVGTVVALYAFFPIGVIALVGVVEAIIHYHVDWAKMSLNRAKNWSPTTSEQFWWLLGADQWVHYMTYVGMVAYLTHVF